MTWKLSVAGRLGRAHIPGGRIKKKPEWVDIKLLNYILESGFVSSPWIEEKPRIESGLDKNYSVKHTYELLFEIFVSIMEMVQMLVVEMKYFLGIKVTTFSVNIVEVRLARNKVSFLYKWRSGGGCFCLRT